jgi:hypothetical protein
MTGAQCDSCRKFAVAPSEGWLILFQVQPAASSLMSMIGGGGGGTEVIGTFCSPKCVAEHAYVMAVTGSTGSPA